MKQTKRLLALLLSAAMVLAFAACSSESAPEEETPAETPSEETPAEETPAEETPAETPLTTEADIVVIGAGGAGMTAAIKSAEAGKTVILVEKMSFVGGNTLLGSTSVSAANSKIQQEQGVEGATVDAYYESLVSNTAVNPDAARYLADNSGAAIDWLSDIGMDLTRVFNTFSHGPADGSAPGAPMVQALQAEMDKQGIDYRLNTKATEILMTEGKVSGVKVEGPDGEYEITAPAVILTTGGFAANSDMVAEYDARWEGLGFSCAASSTGDGHLMAEAVGAGLSSMDNIRVNPTVYYAENGSLISMAPIRSNGGIIVNKEGQRCVNENGDYTTASSAIVEQTGGEVYMIFDQTLIDDIKVLSDYNDRGYFVSADTLEGVAEALGIDAAGLASTVETYKGYVAQGSDPDFGRTSFAVDFENAPYYGLAVKPAVQGTFGGITTDLSAQVLDTEGNVIPGLFAAGECADDGTQGSNPLTVCVVFGTLASESAVAYVG